MILHTYGTKHHPTGLTYNITSLGRVLPYTFPETRTISCLELPNPYKIPELRPLTGLQAFVFSSRLLDILEKVRENYYEHGIWDMALFCVGGKHRSVAAAELIKTIYNSDPSTSPWDRIETRHHDINL
jgi:UPF0042 nucleotide-binding protein